MSLAPVILVILAAFIHATWNLLVKQAAAGGPTFVFVYNLVACIAYAPWVAWLLAHGTLTWSLPIAGCILFGGLIHLAYSLCLQRGYQVADLSVVYPVARGTGPTLSSLGAFLLLGEVPRPTDFSASPPWSLASASSRRRATSPHSADPAAKLACAGARPPAC
jgi:drug/metabolite transporter (DMT)-like permease